MKRLRQLFTYSGSKFLLSVMFAMNYARHKVFVSLFGGSSGEFAGKTPSSVEIYNDLDDHLHAVWQVLQKPKRYEQLLALLHNTPNGRKQYEICRQILRDPPHKHSLVRRAWAFLVVGNTCRGGFHPSLAGSWPTACERADKKTHNLMTLPQRLAEWRERFRRVRIEHADWYSVFNRYDRYDTLFFADPPYFPTVLRSGGALYRHLLTIQMHAKLLRTLSAAKGYVMICGYNHPLYTAYLFHWRKVEFPAKAHMGGKGNPRREVIWTNYLLPHGEKIGSNKLWIAKRYLETLGGGECAQRYLDRIAKLLELPRPSGQASTKKSTWLNYTDDGRRLPSTKMMIARRYVEMLGSPAAAQRYLDRIRVLLDLPK